MRLVVLLLTGYLPLLMNECFGSGPIAVPARLSWTWMFCGETKNTDTRHEGQPRTHDIRCTLTPIPSTKSSGLCIGWNDSYRYVGFVSPFVSTRKRYSEKAGAYIDIETGGASRERSRQRKETGSSDALVIFVAGRRLEVLVGVAGIEFSRHLIASEARLTRLCW